jgi:hypothetical protein
MSDDTEESEAAEFDCDYTDAPVCPHCGHKHDLSDRNFDDQDYIESWCDSCEMEFTTDAVCTWTFSTKKGHTATAYREKWLKELHAKRASAPIQEPAETVANTLDYIFGSIMEKLQNLATTEKGPTISDHAAEKENTDGN